MIKQEEIQEGIDRDIEFVLMAAYYAGQTGESISETIDKCKAHLKEALHSQGVVIKIEEEPDEDSYYGDMPGEMYRNGWRRFGPLLKEVEI